MADERQVEAEGRSLDVAALVGEHHRAVFAYAYRLSGSVGEAEDLTQQTFLTAHQKGGQIREPARVLGWLLTVARNCYLKELRRRTPVAAVDLELDLASIPSREPRRDDIDEELLQTAIASLPESYRIVLLMFYFEDLSYREIAAQLDVPIGTVMSRLSRAKQHLRGRLLEVASPEELFGVTEPVKAG